MLHMQMLTRVLQYNNLTAVFIIITIITIFTILIIESIVFTILTIFIIIKIPKNVILLKLWYI